MSAPLADGVMAATHRLVQQAMTGQWQDVPKTLAERRVLLDRLSASASPHDQPWLNALQEAMAESDAAVARISEAQDAAPMVSQRLHEVGGDGASGDVDVMMNLIRTSR